MSVLTYFQRRQHKKLQAVSTIDEAIPLLARGDDVDDDAVEAAQLAADLSDVELETSVALCRRRLELIAELDRANHADAKANDLQQQFDELDAAETARRKAYADEIEPIVAQRNHWRNQASTTAMQKLFETCDPRVKDRLASLRQQVQTASKGLSYAQMEVAQCQGDVAAANDLIAYWRPRDNNSAQMATARETLHAHHTRLIALQRTVAERDAEVVKVSAAIRRLESLQRVAWVTPEQIEAAVAG